MSYFSTHTSSHNNGMEGDVLGLRLTGCVGNLPIKKFPSFFTPKKKKRKRKRKGKSISIIDMPLLTTNVSVLMD